jgi:hypothetical protein
VIDTCRSVVLHYRFTLTYHTEDEPLTMPDPYGPEPVACTLPAGHDGLHEGRTAGGRVIRWR